MTSLEKLVTDAQNGNSQAFSDLYSESYENVFLTALSIIKNKTVAEDLTQDVFIIVLKSLPELRQPAQYYSWLHRITYNRCINFIKRESYQTDELIDADSIPDTSISDNPLLSCIQDERQRIIANALLGMPTKYRVVLLMKYYHGFKIDEIAAILDCAPGTVKSRMNRGKQLLRKALSAKGISRSLLGVIPIGPAMDSLGAPLVPDHMMASSNVKGLLMQNGQAADVTVKNIALTTTKSAALGGGTAVITAGIAAVLITTGVFIGVNQPWLEPSPQSTGTQTTVEDAAIPQIVGITLPESFSASAPITIAVDNPDTVKAVYLLDDFGNRMDIPPQVSGVYTATVNVNGHFQAVVEAHTGHTTIKDFTVSVVDNTPPQLVDYHWEKNRLSITLKDDSSGIDMSSLYADTDDGTRLFPAEADNNTGTIIFEMPKSGAAFYFKDMAGNEDRLIIETESNLVN